MSSPPEGLGATRLFAGLPAEAVEEARRAAISRRLEEGQFFFFQGDPADTVFVLAEGRVKLAQVSVDGQQVVMNVICPWTSFGVLAAVEGSSYPVSAEAAAPSIALAWPRPAVQELMARYPQLALNIMGVISRHAQDFQTRVRELSTERVERRVARAVLRLAQQMGRKTEAGVLIDMAVSRQDLAEMTATTLFTVSRILSQWEAKGLIETGRERITVRFPHGLVAIAEDLPLPGESA